MTNHPLEIVFWKKGKHVNYQSYGADDFAYKEANELIVKSRSMESSWGFYLEDGQGPDPAGIYLFGADGGVYLGFDVALE
jgi:hypothetical protein